MKNGMAADTPEVFRVKISQSKDELPQFVMSLMPSARLALTKKRFHWGVVLKSSRRVVGHILIQRWSMYSSNGKMRSWPHTAICLTIPKMSIATSSNQSSRSDQPTKVSWIHDWPTQHLWSDHCDYAVRSSFCESPTSEVAILFSQRPLHRLFSRGLSSRYSDCRDYCISRGRRNCQTISVIYNCEFLASCQITEPTLSKTTGDSQ